MKHRMGLEAAGGQPPDPRDIWINIKDKRGAFILILISSGVSRACGEGEGDEDRESGAQHGTHRAGTIGHEHEYTERA